MLALILLCSSFVSAQAVPGTSYASAATAVTLHAGPGQAHPGVMELDAGAVLRVGELRGQFREVFVPQGYPVYLHGDFAAVDAARQVARPAGERLNVRLLPSTVGLLPVGQVGTDDGELVLLGHEGVWVRVLAPVSLPLYAPADALTTLDDGAGAARWERTLRERETRREQLVRARELGDPAFVDDLRTRLHVELLARRAPAALDEAALASLLDELAGLEQDAQRPETRAALGALADEARVERLRRSQVADAAERERERTQEQAADLEREARALATGLRFLGKGDEITITGRVSRRVTPDGKLSVYSIADDRGRTFKLSAARNVADLTELSDRTVTVRGRSLTLVNVGGPVLIVDAVDEARG